MCNTQFHLIQTIFLVFYSQNVAKETKNTIVFKTLQLNALEYSNKKYTADYLYKCVFHFEVEDGVGVICFQLHFLCPTIIAGANIT